MISNDGKDVIREFFAGANTSIANFIVLGTGTTAPALTDTALATEVYRISVSSAAADSTNGRVVFKGVLPAGSVPTIYEVGIVNAPGDTDTERLVARTVLTTPKVTDPEVPTEIEYSLKVTV
jgi:hypothetical protein